MYISVPNMKFLCLPLCQEEVCTDDTNDASAANANTNTNDDGQGMIM